MAALTIAATSAVASRLAEEIATRIPGVQSVFYLENEKQNTVTVWSVVPSFDRKIRELVYRAEERLMDTLPETLFDFYVVSSTDAVPSAAASA